MTDETATVETLAPDTAVETEDAELSAAYQRITGGEAVEDAPEAATEAETPEDGGEATDAADEPVKAILEAPTDQPAPVRDAWDKIPEAARDAIVAQTRDMGRKLAEQGRLVQGLAPIKDALATAARDIPALMNMRPADIAAEMLELAKVSQGFEERPLETMMGLIRKHGLQEQLAQVFAGQPAAPAQTAELRSQITALQRQVQSLTDPNYFRSQVTQITAERDVENVMQTFASTAEHWAAVEDHLPNYIQIVQAELGPSASPQDVLAAAYDLAVQRRLPETKAKTSPANAAQAVPDPKKTEAAIKAKSVNVASSATGKPRELTEDEALSAAYRRIMAK